MEDLADCDYDCEVKSGRDTKIDVNIPHRIVAQKVGIEMGVVTSKKAPEDLKWEEFDDLSDEQKEEVDPSWLSDRVCIDWELTDTNISMTTRWGLNSLNISDNPKFVSNVVKLGRCTKTDLVEGSKFLLSEIIGAGSEFEVYMIENTDESGKPTGFHRMDMDRIKLIKHTDGEPQSPIKTEGEGQQVFDVAPELAGKVLGACQGAKNKEEALEMLGTQENKYQLIGVFHAMNDKTGAIVYPIGE